MAAIRKAALDELPGRPLLRETIQEVLMPASEPEDFDQASAILRPELRSILRLSMDLRGCFVLRALAGLDRADCAKLLHLTVPEVDAGMCAAAQELARLRLADEHFQ